LSQQTQTALNTSQREAAMQKPLLCCSEQTQPEVLALVAASGTMEAT
jgi:hypothetical protein